MSLEFYHMEGAVVNQTYAGLHLGMLGAYHTDLRRKYDPARNEYSIPIGSYLR